MILSRQDQVCPVYAEQLDHDCDPEGDPDEQAIARALTDDDLGEPLPLPQLTENNSDRDLLAKQQLRDHSLHLLREWADKGRSEYSWKDRVLVHTLEEGGETSVRIVVPVDRRTRVLRLAHPTLTGGHFSHKRTSAVLKKTGHLSRYWQGRSELVFNLFTLPEGSKAYRYQCPSETLTRDTNPIP